MEIKLLLLLFITLLAVSIFATPQEDLRNGNHEFSANMYSQVARINRNKNFIFSSFTLQTILAMVTSADYAGNSETVQEIRNVLGLPRTNTLTEEAFKSTISNINKFFDDDFKIFDACKLYFAHGYTVQQWYKDIVLDVYQAEVETVNFEDATTSTNIINDWVAKKTNQKITKFVSPGDVNRNTRNILVNALYLMGKWDLPFIKEDNVWMPFTGPMGTKTVEMMTQTQNYEYAEDTDAQYLKMELLRNGGNAYIELVLPHQVNGLKQVEKNIRKVLGKQTFVNAKVSVALPKFGFESNVHLRPLLMNLGVNKIFDMGVELSGIAYNNDKWSKVSDVYQKSYIQVSEWGIIGGSTTKVDVSIDTPPNPLLKNFNANHPFLFKIVVDDMVIFAGHVVNP